MTTKLHLGSAPTLGSLSQQFASEEKRRFLSPENKASGLGCRVYPESSLAVYATDVEFSPVRVENEEQIPAIVYHGPLGSEEFDAFVDLPTNRDLRLRVYYVHNGSVSAAQRLAQICGLNSDFFYPMNDYWTPGCGYFMSNVYESEDGATFGFHLPTWDCVLVNSDTPIKYLGDNDLFTRSEWWFALIYKNKVDISATYEYKAYVKQILSVAMHHDTAKGLWTCVMFIEPLTFDKRIQAHDWDNIASQMFFRKNPTWLPQLWMLNTDAKLRAVALDASLFGLGILHHIAYNAYAHWLQWLREDEVTIFEELTTSRISQLVDEADTLLEFQSESDSLKSARKRLQAFSEERFRIFISSREAPTYSVINRIRRIRFEDTRVMISQNDHQFSRLKEFNVNIASSAGTNIGIKQNQRAQYFTVVASVFLPISLVTSLFGMNIRELGQAQGPPARTFVTITVVGSTVVGCSIIFLRFLWTALDLREKLGAISGWAWGWGARWPERLSNADDDA